MKTKMLSRHVMAGANGTLSVVALLGPMIISTAVHGPWPSAASLVVDLKPS